MKSPRVYSRAKVCLDDDDDERGSITPVGSFFINLASPKSHPGYLFRFSCHNSYPAHDLDGINIIINADKKWKS